MEKLGLEHDAALDTKQVTVSQGIEIVEPSLSMQPKTLFEAVDNALHEAKQGRRINIVCNTI